MFAFFTRKRHSKNLGVPPGANFQFVQGDNLYTNAGQFATEPTVGNPLFLTRVFPQWNFDPISPYQPPMVFSGLALPQDLPQGFPYGGLQPTGLISPSDYPNTTADPYQ